MENLEPPLRPPGWENGAFWLLRGFILDLGGGGGGDGGLLFQFILSKIVVPDPHKKILRGGNARGLGEFSTVIKPPIEGKRSRKTLCYGTD